MNSRSSCGHVGERKRNERLKTKSKSKGSGDSEAQAEAQQDATEPQKEHDEQNSTAPSTDSPSVPESSPKVGVALADLDLTNWDWDVDVDVDVDVDSQVSIPSEPLQSSTFLSETSGSYPEFLASANVLSGTFSMPQLFSPPDPAQAVFSLSNSPASFDTFSSSSPSSSSQDHEFPDSYLLPVHELTLLKGMLRIASRLGVDSTQVWNLECPSPFTTGSGTPIDQLPTAWRPTASQMTIPHHPICDLLPWPSARDRILMFLALPDDARPPNARGPMALVNFVYDLEDGSEGVRIYGADPCNPEGWEVGQVLFERWWFLFDRDIITNSNRWREARGAPPLQIKAE